MSRFEGYESDYDMAQIGLWIGRVRSSVTSKKAQVILGELQDALEAMPVHRLIEGALCKEGEVCAVGALAVHRKMQAGMDRSSALANIEAEYGHEEGSAEITTMAGEEMGMSHVLAWVIAQANDERFYGKSPEQRYDLMLNAVKLARAGQWRAIVTE